MRSSSLKKTLPSSAQNCGAYKAYGVRSASNAALNARNHPVSRGSRHHERKAGSDTGDCTAASMDSNPLETIFDQRPDPGDRIAKHGDFLPFLKRARFVA